MGALGMGTPSKCGLKPPNLRRIHRLMKVRGLLLDRHAGGVEGKT
jgi:hypothetical protein